MIVNTELGNLVRLGECIESTEKRNYDLFYGSDDVVGMTITKQIIPTKADVENTDLTKFLIVSPREFVYNPRTHGKKIGLGFNNTDKTVMISWNNISFKVKDSKLDISVMPEYLYILFCRDEWDREACYRALGSSTEVFSWGEMCDMKIPLPSIEVQQELVDTYNGLKALAEQNEALSKPLIEACQAYIVDCKKKYPEVELGEHIEPCDERNRDLSIKLSQGISNTKEFQSPKQVAANSNNDKVVRKGQFAYNRATTRNGEKISIAYRIGADCTVSSAYQVFEITNTSKLNPHFLLLWFKRSEFDRYARYVSKGSAHEFFEFDDMCQVRIPLPTPEVQQAIVNIYNCAEEAKNIANEAREKMKMLCPALVQRAINGKSDPEGVIV